MIYGCPWWLWLILIGLALAVTFLVYLVGKHLFYYPLKLAFTKPFTKEHFMFCRSGFWDDYISYFRVNGNWYTDNADKDWSEASFSEPVNTLLSLIYEDYDNFEWSGVKTSGGNVYKVHFKHQALDIDTNIDLCDGNSVDLSGESFYVTRRELYTIRNFFVAIQDNRQELLEKQRETTLVANRAAKKDIVTNKMKTYLHKGE